MTSKGLTRTMASTNGLRKTIYEIRRDDTKVQQRRLGKDSVKPFPFKTSGYYKGEWKDNEKEGYGVQVQEDGSRYEGEFIANKYHGRGTLWQVLKVPNSTRSRQVKAYAGEWQRGKMHGHGQQTDAEGNVYIGLFSRGQRSGVGKLEKANGDIYEGEWENDVFHGAGVLTYHTGNVFEGSFANGKKEGAGKHYYASTEKVYEGEWLEDVPRCGYIREPDGAEKRRFTNASEEGDDNSEHGEECASQTFRLPECGLVDPTQVLSEALSSIKVDRVALQHVPRPPTEQNEPPLSQFLPDSAQQLFDSKCEPGLDSVPLIELQDVFSALGVTFSFEDLAELAAQLEITMETRLSFVEVTEIAAYIMDAPEISDENNA